MLPAGRPFYQILMVEVFKTFIYLEEYLKGRIGVFLKLIQNIGEQVKPTKPLKLSLR